MFTLQELLWMKDGINSSQFVGTFDAMLIEAQRAKGVLEKLDALLADHPEDEQAEAEEKKKPAKKK